jgi:pseudaminic acid cytidylyltransferase
MSAVAIIPARGGSKRIPRKNIRDFLGKPILAYSIAAARDCGLFGRILVSTDDEEIAAVARQWGAETPFVRPPALADDHTGTNAVVAHALRWLQEQQQRVELACCIYATAPFVQPAALVEGHRLLSEQGRAFAFAVTQFEFPIQRALRRHADGSVEAMQPQFADTRSQDLEHAWHDAGQFYWGRAEAFLAGTPVYAKTSVGVPIARHLVQDIDTLEDWRRAELMYRVLQDKSGAA